MYVGKEATGFKSENNRFSHLARDVETEQP